MMQMRAIPKIGIIGGLSPESTILYYKGLIQRLNDIYSSEDLPEILIDSVPLQRMKAWFDAGQFEKCVEWMIQVVKDLHAAGAGLVAIASNTPHLLYKDIVKASPVPMVSIVEAVCQSAIEHGFRAPALLGTRFTMQMDFYPDVFNPSGIGLKTPCPEEQESIHNIIFSELIHDKITPQSRQDLFTVIRRMHQEDDIDSVILGCTELPLIIKPEDTDLPLLDTAEIHMDAIVKAYQGFVFSDQ